MFRHLPWSLLTSKSLGLDGGALPSSKPKRISQTYVKKKKRKKEKKEKGKSHFYTLHYNIYNIGSTLIESGLKELSGPDQQLEQMPKTNNLNVFLPNSSIINL